MFRDDERNEMLQWCQGAIEKIINKKSNDKHYIIASIKWNDEFTEEGRANPTKEMLKKKITIQKYIMIEHGERTYDIYWIIKISEGIAI